MQIADALVNIEPAPFEMKSALLENADASVNIEPAPVQMEDAPVHNQTGSSHFPPLIDSWLKTNASALACKFSRLHRRIP